MPRLAEEQRSVMEDTGRIRQPLQRRARDILFGTSGDAAIRDEFPYYAQIDRAHVIMLVERRILALDVAGQVLGAIDRLAALGFEPLRGRSALRGSYLLYEEWLIETLGERLGGAVHIGRSRNDMNATLLRLRIRPVYRWLVSEVLRLVGVLIRRAHRYIALAMPIYTHYQAAMPITYGHYLTGVAVALLRDLQGVEDAVRELDRCPLGAGAAAGTTVPIDCGRTAQLLGFAEPVLHSIDAVATRDLILRLLSATGVMGVTLSRLAADLQLWSTAEFALLEFPDTLVGSSSMMPQKRNAFLLEHIKGRSVAPLGAFTAAATAMHATPYSNSVAVGTEGVRPFWSAITELTEAVVLARLAIAGAQPQPHQMHQRAVDGFTAATEVVNRLVLECGLSFRQAHHRVGAATRAANEGRESLARAAGRLLHAHGLADDADWLDPECVAARAESGGGPGQESVRRVLAQLRRQSSDRLRSLSERSRRWKAANRQLDAAVKHLLHRCSFLQHTGASDSTKVP